MMGCVSALEIACWDIIGKEAGRPVHKLLGGRVHETLRSYTYLYPTRGVCLSTRSRTETATSYNDPDLAAQCALDYVAQGFGRREARPGRALHRLRRPPAAPRRQVDLSARMCAAIRGAVGTSCDILFRDPMASSRRAARCAWRAPSSPMTRCGSRSRCRRTMPEEMALVARATSIPIATGERLTTKMGVRPGDRESRRPSILQPDLGRSGGILRDQEDRGHGRGAPHQIAPHCYCGPIVGAANIQVALTLPNFLILDRSSSGTVFNAELLKQEDRMAGRSRHSVATNPVSASSSTRRSARRIPWSGPQLHLVMADRPLNSLKRRCSKIALNIGRTPIVMDTMRLLTL